jgi:hypothetical protein
MPIFAATDYDIVINSVNLSDHIDTVELDVEVDELETTNFDSDGNREYVGGLRKNTLTLNFLQNYSASEVEQTIYPLIGLTTSVTVKPTSATMSSTNPAYIATVLVSKWQPIGAKVGDVPRPSVSWPVSGAVTKSNGA